MTRDLIHGGTLDAVIAAYPNVNEAWIDLSTGINPWPYEALDIAEATLARLPTRTEYEACRAAMAAAIGADQEALLLAPGSELIIRLLPDLIQPKRVAVLAPTYGDHADAWSRAGADIIHAVDPLAHAASVDAVIVTQPNNPDGQVFALEALEKARATLAARGGWLIIDEAYADLIPAQSFAQFGGAEGLIILRSFGKFFGLPGLRLGGLLAPPDLRAAMAERLGIWPISGPALEIGARAYADLDWQARTRQRLEAATLRLDRLLRDHGFAAPSGTHLFRFIDVEDAYRMFDQLAHQGIYVRRFRDSKTHLRIGLPPTGLAEARLRAALSLSV